MRRSPGAPLALAVLALCAAAACARSARNGAAPGTPADTAAAARAGSASAPGSTAGAASGAAGGLSALPDSAFPLVPVGSPLVDGARLHPDSNTLRMVLSQGGQSRQAGTMTQVLRPVTVDGRAAYLRVQIVSAPGAGDVAVDSAYVNRKTLAPIRRISRDPGRRTAYVFEGAHVVGAITDASGKTQPLDQHLDAPLFDSNPLDLVIRALPLKTGFRARLPTYEPELGGRIVVRIDVLGQDSAQDSSGHMVPAWVVEVSHGGVAGRFWIGEKRRTLLRQVAHSGPALEMRWEH